MPNKQSKKSRMLSLAILIFLTKTGKSLKYTNSSRLNHHEANSFQNSYNYLDYLAPVPSKIRFKLEVISLKFVL